MKKIKPCIENILIALEACAKAHNSDFENWIDEGQVGIKSETIPTYADVKSIVRAFYNDEYADEVEIGWGYITVYLYDEVAFREEVDEMTLMMALPYGIKLPFVKE